MENRLHIARASLSLDDDAAFSELCRLARPDAIRHPSFWNRRKVRLGAPEDVVGLDIPGDDERRVVWNVEPPIVANEIVARHRPQIIDPPDRRMPIRMR